MAKEATSAAPPPAPAADTAAPAAPRDVSASSGGSIQPRDQKLNLSNSTRGVGGRGRARVRAK